jgi:hypothetical protein
MSYSLILCNKVTAAARAEGYGGAQVRVPLKTGKVPNTREADTREVDYTQVDGPFCSGDGSSLAYIPHQSVNHVIQNFFRINPIR